MRRVSISEITAETGLSRATVDRVLNGRDRVHPRTKAVVEAALHRLGAPAAQQAAAAVQADIVMRVGKGMLAQLRSAWEVAGARGHFDEMYLASEDAVLQRITTRLADRNRPLIVIAKNDARLTEALAEARGRGKRVIALVSDLAAEARDVFVGIDNRAAGQTAAFLIGRALGDRPTTVGVVLGDLAFRCHEDREIGFRTGLRAHFPKVVLSGEAQGEDSFELTRDAVGRMLQAHPALGAVYNVGGGNGGLAEALRLAGRQDMLVVGHEVNTVTAPLLRAGDMDFAIAAGPGRMLARALALAAVDPGQPLTQPSLLDFGVYTRFNLPVFAQTT